MPTNNHEDDEPQIPFTHPNSGVITEADGNIIRNIVQKNNNNINNLPNNQNNLPGNLGGSVKIDANVIIIIQITNIKMKIITEKIVIILMIITMETIQILITNLK